MKINEEIDDSNDNIEIDEEINDSNVNIEINEEIDDSNIEIDSVDSEDFREASFEDAVNEAIEEVISQWPNQTYQEFAKICIDYDLSNQATDSFIHFFNKNANLEKFPLPKIQRKCTNL